MYIRTFRCGCKLGREECISVNNHLKCPTHLTSLYELKFVCDNCKSESDLVSYLTGGKEKTLCEKCESSLLKPIQLKNTQILEFKCGCHLQFLKTTDKNVNSFNIVRKDFKKIKCFIHNQPLVDIKAKCKTCGKMYSLKGTDYINYCVDCLSNETDKLVNLVTNISEKKSC